MADRLVELTLGAPAGLVPDLAGPTVYGHGRAYARLESISTWIPSRMRCRPNSKARSGLVAAW